MKIKNKSTSSEVSYNSCTYAISPTTAQLAQKEVSGTVQVSTRQVDLGLANSNASCDYFCGKQRQLVAARSLFCIKHSTETAQENGLPLLQQRFYGQPGRW